MIMALSIKALEEYKEVTCIMSVSITGGIAQFGAWIIGSVNKKLFEQFIQNFCNLLAQENGEATTSTNSTEPESVKATSLIGSVIMSELKKKPVIKIKLG